MKTLTDPTLNNLGPDRNTQIQAYLELSVAMIIVGSGVVVSKFITSNFPIFLAAAVRFAISSAILLPILFKAEGGFPALSRKDAGVLFLQAFAGNFLFSIFLLYGLRLTSAAESGIILGTVPVLIGLIACLFLKEALTWRKATAWLIATIGIGVISSSGASASGSGGFPLLGYLLVFGAALGESLWTILGKAVSRTASPLVIASLTSFYGLLLFLPLGIYQASQLNFLTLNRMGWVAAIYYGIATVGAYVFWYRGVARVAAGAAGVFTGIQPVSAVVLSNLFLHEPIFLSYWVGIVSVLAAIGLLAGKPAPTSSVPLNGAALTLHPEHLRRVNGERWIICETGRLWITQTGDAQDYLLLPGDMIRVSRHARVLIGGVPGKAVTVRLQDKPDLFSPAASLARLQG